MSSPHIRLVRPSHYFLLRFAGWLIDYVTLFAVPVLAFKETGELGWSGIAVFVQWSPRVLSLLGASLFTDRWPIRGVLVGADVVRTALVLCAAGALEILDMDPLIVLMAVSFVIGLCFEQTFVAGEKLARIAVAPQKQDGAQSMLTALEQGSCVLGPIIGALLIGLPMFGFMLSLAAMYALSAGLSVSIPRLPPTETGVVSFKSSLAASLKTPLLRRLVVVSMGLNFLLSLVVGLAAGMTDAKFNLDAEGLGLVFAVGSGVSVGCLIFAPMAIRHVGLLRFGIGIAVAMCAAVFGLGLAASLLAYIMVLTLLITFDSLFSVYMRTMRVRAVPAANYGSTVAVFSLLIVIPIPLAGIAVAAFGSLIGPDALLVISAVVILAVVLITIPKGEVHESVSIDSVKVS